MPAEILGIDIGGSGIKGALVDTEKGDFASDRLRLDTPSSGKPEEMLKLIEELIHHFRYEGPIGIGFPGVVQRNRIQTAANLHADWVGTDLQKELSERTGRQAHVLNDADSAGYAEVRYGAAKDVPDVVLVVTLGTGIGTSLYTDGKLVPNTELGHVYLENGKIAEPWAAELARKQDKLKWPQWGKRVNVYLNELHKLFWPELVVIGGGVSKKFDKWKDALETPMKVVPATLENRAGIVGAAIWAQEHAQA